MLFIIATAANTRTSTNLTNNFHGLTLPVNLLAIDYRIYFVNAIMRFESTKLPYIFPGERRRVQLVMGLMEPWDLLLIDEMTVDLDVLVRVKFLQFLKEETETRRATIVSQKPLFLLIEFVICVLYVPASY